MALIAKRKQKSLMAVVDGDSSLLRERWMAILVRPLKVSQLSLKKRNSRHGESRKMKEWVVYGP